MLSRVGENVPDEKTIRSISGITARDAMAILAPEADEARVLEILESYRTHYRSGAGVAREPLFEGALEALDRLQANPITKLAVATGKGYRSAITLLERHDIIGRFHSIETPDHNRGKPDPQMIEVAMEKAAALPEETVMIGDTVHDMRMAKAAHVKAIGVAWGLSRDRRTACGGRRHRHRTLRPTRRRHRSVAGRPPCVIFSKRPMRIATTAMAGRRRPKGRCCRSASTRKPR